MASDKRIVLVTGANNGIGYETVLALAQQPASFHILLGSRSVEKGKQALQKIHAALEGETTMTTTTTTISVLQLDVTDQASIAAARDAIEAEHGRLDVLINNAGIIAYGESDLLASLRATFETNVFGTMLLTETLLPLLRRSSSSSSGSTTATNKRPLPYIIYVSSSQGSVTSRLDPAYPHRHARAETYRMSKAALNMLAACHRYNLDPRNDNNNSNKNSNGGNNDDDDAAAEFRGCKVLAFDPGWCVTDLTGAWGREMRAKHGARSPREPADALVEIVMGRRDADVEENGMLTVGGGICPW